MADKLADLAVHLRCKYGCVPEVAEEAAQEAFLKLQNKVQPVEWGLMTKAGHEVLIDTWRKEHSSYYNELRRIKDYDKRRAQGKPSRIERPEEPAEAYTDTVSADLMLQETGSAIWDHLQTETLEDIVCATETVHERIAMQAKPLRCKCCDKFWIMDPRDKSRDIPNCQCTIIMKVSSDNKFNMGRCTVHETEHYIGAHVSLPPEAAYGMGLGTISVDYPAADPPSLGGVDMLDNY